VGDKGRGSVRVTKTVKKSGTDGRRQKVNAPRQRVASAPQRARVSLWLKKKKQQEGGKSQTV